MGLFKEKIPCPRILYLLVDHMQILKFCTLRLSVKMINLEKKTVSAHAECFNKNNEK